MTSRIYIDIQTLSPAELEATHGIEIDEDGTVWDELEGMEFATLREWADYCVEREEEEHHSFVKLGGKIQLVD